MIDGKNADSDAELQASKTAVNDSFPEISSELGALLIIVGITGIVVPGPIGVPFLIAGCLVFTPKPVTRFLQGRFPRVSAWSATAINRYLSDMDRRFPEQTQVGEQTKKK